MSESDSGRDRAGDGLAHLQNAAHELIAAARAALDVAEEMIDDPELASSVSVAAGRFGEMLRGLVPDSAGLFAPRGPDSVDESGSNPEDSRVERIIID